MKIVDVKTKRLSIPLKKPFKTSLRTVSKAESIVVYLFCDDGTVGIGAAPPTHIITGDSLESINYAVIQVIRPLIIGQKIEQKEQIDTMIRQAIVHNSSAKAAVDIAVYDCLGKKTNLPLYQLLGGYKSCLETDYTVSVNAAEEMAEDARKLVGEGFDTLKVKVGNSTVDEDIERVSEIRRAVGGQIKLRLDVNQGWGVKEAISAIHRLEDMGIGIELVEQPIPAWNVEGMKTVTESVDTPIMADESVFDSLDAARLLAIHGCDLINIKLMKAGGISGAEKINALAEVYGVECMVGCMIESKISVTAACHFAAGKKNVTRCDFDAPLMLASEPVIGGVHFEGNRIFLPADPGLGIKNVLINQ
ncbi:dipeptide epimerase [Sporolactobacillus pectinivorans]|uniref:dipeptide epimerase n=1 Tax=Sporolactobacillus pectinivorans TaxID=1591408 RepID=UPI000C26589C|nr:dipeptide epimerase [Sporolactobacillus pectinivorans]